MKTIKLILFVSIASPLACAYASLDAYPEEIALRLSRQYESERSAIQKLGGPEANFLFDKRRWTPGTRILVAFNGGTPDLHRAISEQASLWAKVANLQLDFGFNPATKQFRSWSASDTQYSAHIRIGFEQEGYWSYIGTDSVSQNAPPSSASMNFAGFDKEWPTVIPARWKTVVIHEFGHAIGMHHEHQHVACANEFRWVRGPTGEPDVYDVFRTWLRWSKAQVDVNLRPVPEASLIATTPTADRKSIMFYAMPSQAYVKGPESSCFIPAENTSISAEDARGARIAYPKDPTEAAQLSMAYDRTIARAASNSAGRSSLSGDEREAVDARFEAILTAKKPLLYVHIQRETDRGVGEAIRNAARDQGFIAPGVENVSRKGLKSGAIPEVRYFRVVDENSARAAAETLATVLSRGDVKVVRVKSLQNAVGRNLVEVWLP
jgi:hypothetical protein